MEKVKLTKFQLILLLLVVIIGGGLIALGVVKKAAYGKNIKEYEDQKNSLESMEEMQGYPNEKNVNILRDGLVSYKGQVESVRNSLKARKDDSFVNTDPATFSSSLEKAYTGVKDLYEEKNIELPREWYLGFEQYSSDLPAKGVTGLLGYQVEALNWLHTELATYNPSKLNNLYRKPVEIPEKVTGKKKKSKKKKGKKGSATTPSKMAYTSMPIELCFTARESNAREFINSLTQSDEFYFTVDTIKLKSTPAPVVEVDEEEDEEEPESSSSGLGGVFGGGSSSSTQSTISNSNEKIFSQVLGQEYVTVLLDLNLVYLPTEFKLSNIK